MSRIMLFIVWLVLEIYMVLRWYTNLVVMIRITELFTFGHVGRSLGLFIWASQLTFFTTSFLRSFSSCISFCFLMQGITLIILVIHTLFPISYEGYHLYWKSRLNRLKVLPDSFSCSYFLTYQKVKRSDFWFWIFTKMLLFFR